jgi:hypothetical protein
MGLGLSQHGPEPAWAWADLGLGRRGPEPAWAWPGPRTFFIFFFSLKILLELTFYINLDDFLCIF